MLLVFPLTAAKVVGTDIFHAAALLWVAGAGHLVAGNVDLDATGWLLVGSIPGVLRRQPVSVNLPDRALRLELGTTLTLAGARRASTGADPVPVRRRRRTERTGVAAEAFASGRWDVLDNE